MIRVAQVMGYMDGAGVEQVVMNYYRHIDHKEIQFDFLVCEGSKLVPEDEIRSFGGRVFTVPKYQHQLAYQREMARLFREERWSIVHSHVNTLSVFPLFAAKREGVPVRIAHAHSSSGGGEGEGLKDAMKSILRRFSNTFPTHRLACGVAAGRWLFRGAPFDVLPNAIDLSMFRPDLSARTVVREELGIPNNVFVVGHIGRMAPQKNQRRLLSIFRSVLDAEPGSVLVLVGDGPLMEQVREEAEVLGVAERARFLGQRSDAARLYQSFDVFCLPSVYEGLPVVGIECQASGTPILVSTEVSREAAVSSIMEFEPLTSSDDEWASHLVALRGKRLTPVDLAALQDYDISRTAHILEAYYSARITSIEGSEFSND